MHAALAAVALSLRRLAMGVCAVLLAFALAPAWADDVLPVPVLAGHVIDATGTLDAAQKQALETRLAGFEDLKGSQVVVLVVPTTQPEDIASYANRVGNAWKIGRKGIGDGLLLVVAKNDRKVRIEVAKSLEGAIPDLAAKRIIDDAITPNFKKGDFAGGLNAAVDQITALITGEALPEPTRDAASNGGFQWMDLTLLLFFAIPFGASLSSRIFGRKLGGFVTSAGVGVLTFFITASVVVSVIALLIALVYALFVNLFPAGGGNWTRTWGTGGDTGWRRGSGSGSSSSSSSSGGGFSSGGGGDFGGGGASGDW